MELEDKLIEALFYGKVNKIEKVFEDIYEQYYKLVYFCIKQKVAIKEDIEDLTNETFISFYNGLKRNSNIRSLKSYLCKIAINKANDYLNKQKDVVLNIDENMSSDFKDNNDIFDLLKSKCSEKEYYILIHHVIYEESFKEISLDINEKINTIKSIYHRLIIKLRKETL